VSWLNNPYFTVNKSAFTSLNQTQPVSVDPWQGTLNEKTKVSGTDGLQFSPNLNTSTPIHVFSSDLSRSISYAFDHTDDKQFKGFRTQIWLLEPSNFAKGTFMSTFDGSTNLTSSYDTLFFATNGNFFGASSEVQGSIPVNSSG
jgi:hypothetical protein